MQNGIYSFRAFIKKELMEGIRTQKFLVLAIGILFFSIADPVLLKFMPEILKSQAQGIDFSSFINLTQTGALVNYTKSLYQIGTFIIAFSLMGIIGAEISNKTLTIPMSMGCRVRGILIGKLLVYGGYLVVLTLTGLTIAYIYSGQIFSPDPISYLSIIKAGLLYAIFYIFIVSILMLMNSLVEKPYIAGIVALLISYGMPLLGNINGLGKYIPNALITEANRFNMEFTSELLITLICTLVIIITINIITGLRLKKISYI